MSERELPESTVAIVNDGNTAIKIEGACASHAIITDTCRLNRGDEGVIDETLARTRKALERALGGWPNSAGTQIHVVVTVERRGGT